MLWQSTLILDNAELLTLQSTGPATIASSPGPNKIAYPLFAMLRLTGTTGYGNADTDGVYMTISPIDFTQNITPLVNDAAIAVSDLQTFFSGPFPQQAEMFALPGPISPGQGNVNIARREADASLAVDDPLVLFLVTAGDLTGGAAGNELKVALFYVVYNILTGQFELP